MVYSGGKQAEQFELGLPLCGRKRSNEFFYIMRFILQSEEVIFIILRDSGLKTSAGNLRLNGELTILHIPCNFGYSFQKKKIVSFT